MTLLAEAVNFFTADEVLSPFVYVFYAAFLIAWVFTPIMRMVAVQYGIVDQPDLIRKLHTSPVAYLGGVAVFLGWMGGLAISQYVFLYRNAPGLPHVIIHFGVVIGACIIVGLGLWDDLRKIKPAMKIAGQVLAACLLISADIGTNLTKAFLEPIQLRLEVYGNYTIDPTFFAWFVWITSSLLVIAIVVFCCNATNLMDGLDGLCGGVTGIVSMGFLLLAVHISMFNGGADVNNDALRVVLGLALVGGVLGFVPYNFNPASIFMGDAGSMFLGFASALMIILCGQVASKWLLASSVMFALPILDTSLAFARRYVNSRPFFSPDRHHLHHQLVARGLTIRKAVLLSYALAIFFVACGASIVFMRTRYAIAFYLVIFCSIIVAAYKMGMVHERSIVVTNGPDIPIDTAISSPVDPESVLEIREAGASTFINPPGDWQK